jgi:hypothetical protein
MRCREDREEKLRGGVGVGAESAGNESVMVPIYGANADQQEKDESCTRQEHNHSKVGLLVLVEFGGVLRRHSSEMPARAVGWFGIL